MYKEVQPMSYEFTCPDCGSTRQGHHHDGTDAVSRTSERDVNFARVLNGTQWREKPEVAPQYRDDVVPND
jgi:hypothetical protein